MAAQENKYTEEEILAIFKEQHRLCSPLDAEVDPWVEITADMTIREWRRANDLLGWKKLGEFLNQEFRTEISQDVWQNTLEPAKAKKLIDVCQLLSKHAVKDTFEPKTLFGKPCLKAGVFLTIKKNLMDKGVNVDELRPSSSISAYLDKYFSPVLEEITLTGTRPIDKLELRRKNSGFWKSLHLLDSRRFETSTGEVKTFRDLTEKIIEERNQRPEHNRSKNATC
ncbi:MAG: hypothetical protein AAFQ98_22505 [Bacteroidota bacterium]